MNEKVMLPFGCEKCPECGTKGYLIWPGYGDCQRCLALRLAAIEFRKIFSASAGGNDVKP